MDRRYFRWIYFRGAGAGFSLKLPADGPGWQWMNRERTLGEALVLPHDTSLFEGET